MWAKDGNVLINIIFIILMISSSIGTSNDVTFIEYDVQNSPILSLPNLGIANAVMVDVFENRTFFNLTNITEIYNNKTKQMFGTEALKWV